MVQRVWSKGYGKIMEDLPLPCIEVRSPLAVY